MNKQSAEQLIGSTFNYPFDENRFQNFIINFLNFDTNKEFDFVTGSYIRHSFADQIKKYKRLGTYTDPNDKKVDILIVELKNEWSLERSRTMLRNFISDYLKNRDEKDAALVAFYTSNPEDWRFSYIQMEYTRVKINGKFKIEEKITPAKRYSYLVGKNEPNHTAQSQLVGILADDINNPTLSQLENAFSVDNVSIQFYRDYRDQFEKLCNELNKIVKNDKKVEKEFLAKSVDTSNFAKKLMGQIVFLYFLQKKGWLGVDKNEKGNFNNWGTGPKNFLRRLFNKEFTDYKNFFNEVLEPLFYEALATERPNDIFSRFNCKIPFLNGGLFEPINEYNWEETEVTISNKLIESILNTFDQYNFTVREDEPLEKEVAVDPEMLGLVFENLLPENIRKGKGAFYTPRPIVHYMCQESLINYLHNECNQVPNSDIETLVHEGDVILELETAIVEKNKKYESVLMDSIKNNATILDDALANIKVCDPAVGSGAFPVGLMTEIVKARNILSLYIKNNNDSKKRSKYNLKRHCIQNSLYGVDIDSGAIEIAKLRLWLSLIVDEDDYANIEPLPNLDYKIMQGNSLIEEFHGVSFDLEKKPESQQDIFDDNNNLDLLIKDLHNKILEQSNSKHHKDKKLKKEAVEKTFLKILHFVLAKKKDYSKKIASEIEIDLLEMTKGKKERKFFPWKLYFADVFREKGGFDIVIANPPYIGQKGNNEIFRPIKETSLGKQFHQRRMDLFYFFFHQSINLAAENGVINFITTNYYITATYADLLRKDFRNRTSVRQLINFNELRIFESALGQHNLITFLTKDNDNHPVKVISSQKTGFADAKTLKKILLYSDEDTTYFEMPDQNIYEGTLNYIRLKNETTSGSGIDAILDIVKVVGKPLGEICHITQGIVTGADKLSKSHIKKNGINGNIGDGIFALSNVEIEELKLNQTEKIFLKPWFKNSDVHKWITEESTNESLIYYTSKTEKKIGTKLLNHFEKYKPILINRNTRSGTPVITNAVYDKFIKGNYEISYVMVASAFKRGAYYCISYARDVEYFEQPKIVAPQRSRQNTFGYNETSWYASADVYFIIQKDTKFKLKYLLALLNSKLFYNWFYHKGKRKGESLELYLIPLSETPIKIADVNNQTVFVEIVDKIISTKKKNKDTATLEKQIDQMVYKLYNLTAEEIKIVEGESN